MSTNSNKLPITPISYDNLTSFLLPRLRNNTELSTESNIRTFISKYNSKSHNNSNHRSHFTLFQIIQLYQSNLYFSNSSISWNLNLHNSLSLTSITPIIIFYNYSSIITVFIHVHLFIQSNSILFQTQYSIFNFHTQSFQGNSNFQLTHQLQIILILDSQIITHKQMKIKSKEVAPSLPWLKHSHHLAITMTLGISNIPTLQIPTVSN